MGLTAPSLKDMDYWEVSRKRKPAKLNANGNRRPVNVIMWTVDGSAVLAHPQRGRSECCTIALWRRMMCARNVGRVKGRQVHSRIADDHQSDSDLDFGRNDDLLDLGQPQKARMWEDVGPKLQTAFGMRRWPQGWI
ncbi:hypothetical protein M758_6G113100 [Ceratodon purpureus]|uniref:Uncharacterized protein n=1 Tax=Ceratodon purpureus TaxID=3225 RepID=A0A8T0HDH4_CERPU|nr:hypothetical protein KC19_6G118000 [Ceratodon purpureus]KAG0613576.1 hypothetical protein M758_6G113100 [Ceratodon purpureus]